MDTFLLLLLESTSFGLLSWSLILPHSLGFICVKPRYIFIPHVSVDLIADQSSGEIILRLDREGNNKLGYSVAVVRGDKSFVATWATEAFPVVFTWSRIKKAGAASLLANLVHFLLEKSLFSLS